MVFIYDNLTAMIIAMAVFLLLVTIQFRTTQANIAQTSRNIVKEQAQGFATWVEDDLERAGENIDPGETAPYEVAFENPVDSAGLTTEFVFYRDSVQSTTSALRVRTRYRLSKIDTVITENDTMEVYQLSRSQKVGSNSWTWEGKSAAWLGYFKIEMLNRDAQPITNPKAAAQANPDTVRSTRVRFSAVAPFQHERTSLRVVHFGSVLLLRKGN